MFSFVNTLFSLLALFAVIIFTVGLTPYALLFPVPLLILFVFNFGIGLILSGITVYFRDVKHFYGVFVMALNYLTPIFYPVASIDSRLALRLIYLNPMTYFVEMNRNILMVGTWPTSTQLLVTCGWSVGLLAVGLFIFRKLQDKFILHI